MENFFSHAGALLHEVGLYFSVTLEPSSAAMQDVSVFTGAEDKLKFQWLPRGNFMSAKRA